MIGEIQSAVTKHHPGVILESPIQGLVFLREFERGVASYEEMTEKTGLDDRWAGICYFHMHQDIRAVELFYRAISRGVDSARINLAHALGYIERGDEVIPELLKINPTELSTYDKVLFYRVKSLHEETNGDLVTALGDAEVAWELVQGAPHFSILAPDILSQLAVLNGRVGRAQKALAFIDKNLSISTGVDALRARIQRAHILITLGRFTDAILELAASKLTSAPQYLASIVLIYRGEASWALGHLDEAIKYFEKAVEIAASLDLGFEEFLARVRLALLNGVQGKFDIAYEHLNYSESLVGDRSDRLYFRFREVVLERMTGRMSPADSVAELGIVADELGKMGALQEQGWVRFHIAYQLWQMNDQKFNRELDEAQSLGILLQNPAYLTRELALLPEFAKVTGARLGTAPVRTLTVQTLGQEELLLDGMPVQLPLRRAVEILTYFLDRGSVSLGTLIHELFPNEKPRTAKSYFHQFRYQLSQHVHGLHVHFDPTTRTYSLKSEIAIVWDVEALRAGDHSLIGQVFLPDSKGAWARKMNLILHDSFAPPIVAVR